DTTAAAAEHYLRERGQARTARQRDLLAHLQKMREELNRWDEWDALKAEERLHQPSRRPSFSHETLVSMRQMLLDELDRLQGKP
ncbi:MAG TPA: hypothetical protein VGW38_18440, partial [Chloroflexota bacterium]|nr:hypothetical protein [Chloroflexota bacterium]